MISTKKAEKTANFPSQETLSNETIITLNTPEVQSLQGTQEKKIVNQFQTTEEFRAFVKDNFIKGSGIAPELFAESLEFVSEQEFDIWGEIQTPIHERLNWKEATGHKSWENWKGEHRDQTRKKIPLFAAFLVNEDGTDWQAIVSIPDYEKNRPYRYLAPTGIGDRVFLPPVPKTIREKISARYGVEVPLDGSFWEWFETAKIPRIPTEGGKKGLSLLSQGYVGMAMYGCDCGGKETPTPDLSRFNKDGATWLFALDRDTKRETVVKVNASRKRLANVLSSQSVVCIEDIVWEPEHGKGVDDLIVSKGSGAFDIVYSLAHYRATKQSKKGGYDDSVGATPKMPTQSEVASSIASRLKGRLVFNDKRKAWVYYSAETVGIWTEESDIFVKQIVYKILASEYICGFSNAFVGGIADLLKTELFVRNWEEGKSFDYLPFQDGVLEIATGQLLPHAPKYKFTWQLPRPYMNDGNWDNINRFLDDATGGDANFKRTLLCFCNAVLKGRAELQKFLYILGPGGSGKGTFTRLVMSLIGSENYISTDLEQWNKRIFEPARAFGKRLVIFAEQAPYHDEITKFLSLTGQDPLRFEQKKKDAENDFIYPGMVLMAGNIYAFSGYALAPVKRREKLCIFDNKPTHPQDLSPLFEPELSAFTAYLLTISDDEVKAVLTNKNEDNLLDSWETLMSKDTVANWINYHVVADPLGSCQMGRDKDECRDGRPAVTFYGSYASACQKAGGNLLGSNNFGPRFKDLLENTLGWAFERVETNKGVFIKGIRLRVDGLDDHIPSFSMSLRNRLDNKTESGVGSGVLSGVLCGVPETLQDKDYSQSGVQTQKLAENISEENFIDQNQLELSVSSTEVVQPVETALDYIPPSVNAELLRECIADGNWEMIQELTESWDVGYKMEVWGCLTDSEKKAIRELKQSSPSPTSLGYDPNKIPLIKEKATYWSKSKNCKITVFIISAVGDEVQAKVEGKKGIYNFSFNDLACCEESPVSDFAAGDRVKILSNGKRAKVSSVVYQTIYLKDEKNKSLRREFYAHQLEKL